MSQLLIQHYLNELQTLRRVSGTAREGVVSEAFKTLLKEWGKSRDLIFVPQYEYETLKKTRVYPDGALLHELRVPPPAIGRPRTRRTISARKSKRNFARAIRRTTSSSRIRAKRS